MNGTLHDGGVALAKGEWVKHNACVAYVENGARRQYGQPEHWYYALRLFVLSSGALQSVPWPPRYIEMQGLVASEHAISPAGARNMRRARLRAFEVVKRWPQRWHDSEHLAFATTQSMDNLWHATFHAVPTSEFMVRLARSLKRPRELTLWPLYTMYPARSRAVEEWAGWVLIARSMLPAPSLIVGPWGSVVERTQSMLRTGELHCYHTLYGGHARFYPRAWVHFGTTQPLRMRWVIDDLRLALGRYSAFRARVLEGFGLASEWSRASIELAAPPRILFVLRRQSPWHHSRVITNEGALRMAIGQHASLSHRITFHDFFTLPLHEQLRLSSGASGVGSKTEGDARPSHPWDSRAS